jgi:hypothetical protein
MMPLESTPIHQVGRDFPNNTKNAIGGIVVLEIST